MKAIRQKIAHIFNTAPRLRPWVKRWRSFRHFLSLQPATFRFVRTVVLPMIWRTGKRPVLFFRYVGIGDIICTFPAALELKMRHPGAPFIYSCCDDYTCLPGMGGVAEYTISLRIEALQICWSWLFSAIYRFEFGTENEFHASSKVLIEEFCRQFDVPVTNEHPHLVVEPHAAARSQAILESLKLPDGPLIIIHAGPSWPIREWPKSSWSILVERLHERGFANVTQIGVGQLPLSEVVHDVAIPSVISLVDQSTLEEAIALIAQCDLFVGIDSGLLHIAASLRIPAVGIFGPTSPHLRFSSTSSCSFAVSGVECQGCHHRIPCLHWITGCPFDIKCMRTLSADAVLDACLKKLHGRTGPVNRLG